MQVKDYSATSLPEPDALSLAHSDKVSAYIRQAIDDAGGSIGFAEYMQHALYAPALGYYAAGASKFGDAGDFVTAPEISPVFGHVIARQIAALFDGHDSIPGRSVLEFGAGTGAMAADILSRLEKLGALPDEYLVLEVSADLQERQRRTLQQRTPDLAQRVRWIDSLPDSFDGVVIANEVLDALPAERFRKRDGQLFRLGVANAGASFTWVEESAPKPLREAVSRIESELGEALPDGYESEVRLAATDWISRLADTLHRGVIFLFDYGVSAREYYAADRSGGWLRCHYRHRAHSDPFILVGIQDLTTWVDFTGIARDATNSGLSLDAYLTQAQFLLHGGLQEEMLAFDSLTTAAQIELSRQLRVLTMPGEMGENVKCMIFSRAVKGMPESLLAGDRSHTL